MRNKIKVAVNGYGVIGRRVADAVSRQEDMELIGIADVSSDWRVKRALAKGFKLFSATDDGHNRMQNEGMLLTGRLDDLLESADIVVDCAPKHLGAENSKRYRAHQIKFILQGGEKHEAAGHSFVAESNYKEAVGRESTRVVSCNTTSVVRTLTTLKAKGLLKSARGTLLRRATDPWESHLGGILNTLVPEDKIPSHQGPDAQHVDPELDVVTMAVKVPETLGHLHFWSVRLNRNSTKEEVLEAFRESSRIAFFKSTEGFKAINTIKELMVDLNRPYANLYEVALWENLVEVKDDEAFYAYMVDNQAIVIPETIDAIRALTEITADANESIKKTNASLSILEGLVR